MIFASVSNDLASTVYIYRVRHKKIPPPSGWTAYYFCTKFLPHVEETLPITPAKFHHETSFRFEEIGIFVKQSIFN